MIRTKAFGLAFVVLVVISAAAASTAQAGALDLSAGKTKATITGQSEVGQEANLVIPLIGGGNLALKCPASTFEGTVQGQTNITEATVTPTFGPNCKVNGLAANVRMNGCKYTITGAGQAVGTTLLDIVGCTAAKNIEVEQIVTGCIVSIFEQNGLSHIVLAQTGNDITANFTLSNITYKQSNCPNVLHHTQNGSFTANTTVQAFEDTGTSTVTKHGHQYTEHLCGTQINLVVT